MANKQTRVGEIIAVYRKEAGLTLAQLAEQAGCSTVFVKYLEDGERRAGSTGLIRAIATACGHKPDELVEAFTLDRLEYWMRLRPDHLSPEQVERIREIVSEPVAA